MFDPFFPLILLVPVVAFFALLWAQGRVKEASLPRVAIISVVSGLWLLFAVGLAYFAWPLLFFGADDPSTRMYVQVPADQAPGVLIERLTAIAHRQGLHPSSNLISSPEDPQAPTYIFEADGALTRIWAETGVISRKEAIACGYELSNGSVAANDVREPYVNDEWQYYVAVKSIPFFSGRAKATFSQLRDELSRSGYGVSPKPLPCKHAA